MNEELLIGLVKQYPELFDPFDKKYHDELRRNRIWRDVAKIMNESPETCKARWKRIRDNFRRAKTLRKIKLSKGITKNKPVKYEEDLAFLNPILGDEIEKDSKISLNGDEDTGQITSPPSTPGSHDGLRKTTSNKKKKISSTEPPILALLQSYLDKNQPNNSEPVVDFFTNMGRTVNTFPEDVQIRIKGAVFQIVNSAETEVLQRRMLDAGQRLMNTTSPNYIMTVMPLTSRSATNASSPIQNEHYYSSDMSESEIVLPKTENSDLTGEENVEDIN